jgi:glycosyltransferase involved in cell wall biosynthesis
MKKKPPRLIVHITPRFDPDLGGVETHVKELIKAFTKISPDSRQVVLTARASVKNKKASSHFEIYRLSTSSKLRVWKSIWKHKKLLFKADVIHVHDVGWWLAPFWLLFLNKIWMTFHGWETKWPIPVRNKLQRWVWSKLSRGTVHIGSWIQDYYFDKPSKVLFGAPTISCQSVAKWQRKKSAAPWQFVFVGRLSVDNAVPLYILLINYLRGKEVDAEITWVGDGPLKAECQKLGKVVGLVTQPEKYIENADLVFAASYLSILNAQAVGKIVVAMYQNELKKKYLRALPTSDALLISNEPAIVGKEILQLIDNPTRAEALLEKRALLSKMTWQAVAQEYLDLWTDQ